MKMGMKQIVVITMLAVGLAAGNAFAQDVNTSQQQMNGNMMGMQNGGMMGGSMMGGGSGNWQGMGCNGMMGGSMMNQMSPGQRQAFMNQTTDLRKQMMEKRFTYMEAMRNPEATPQDLAKIEKEMLALRTKMMDKMDTLQNSK